MQEDDREYPDASECDDDLEEAGEAPVHFATHRELSLVDLLEAEDVAVGDDRGDGLKAAAWGGVPGRHRADVWRLLTGCAAAKKSRRAEESTRRVKEYRGIIQQYYAKREDGEMARQIERDVKRMQPGVSIFRDVTVQKACHRVLYSWGCRHPGSGYVQGMDAILAPFIVVYLSEVCCMDLLHKNAAVKKFRESDFSQAEADVFWSFSSLMGHIQDFYTPAQPRVQLSSRQVEFLVHKIDPTLHSHLTTLGVDFLRDFMWRWSTCLLVRELPPTATHRLWDTLLSEGPDAGSFLPYISTAFLLHWREELLSLGFNEVMVFLRTLPTEGVTEETVSGWLARGYLIQETYEHMVQR